MTNIRQQMQIQVKGVKEGLLVTLGDGEWLELQDALIAHIQEKGAFFHGARLALDVGNQILKSVDLGNLRDRLSDVGVSLWAILSNSPTTEQTAQMFGLATRLSTPKTERTVRKIETSLNGDEAVFIHRTLRSGFKVEYAGHVVVLGDVNPGAEIIAGGSVIVWGKLRGVVHAGAEGNDQAVVCALDLMPTQLRIAGMIAIPPRRKGKPVPEIARITDGQVVAEPWDQK